MHALTHKIPYAPKTTFQREKSTENPLCLEREIAHFATSAKSEIYTGIATM